MTEHEEFNKLAAAAIHELGRMNARLGLNPDCLDPKAVGQQVYDILNGRDAEIAQLRSEIARLAAAKVKAPIVGELVLAGTMHVSDEILTGVFIRMTSADLKAVKFLPMYRRVVVTEELT